MATVLLQHPIVPGETYARRINGNVTGNSYNINSIGQVVVDTRDAPQFLTKGYIDILGGGGSGGPTSGVAILNFGAFPGSPQASVTVSATDPSDTAAEIDAWVIPVATVDHSADEHTYDPPRVSGAVVGSTIVITGFPSGRDEFVPAGTPFGQSSTSQMPIGEIQCMPYGQWSVAWAFSP